MTANAGDHDAPVPLTATRVNATQVDVAFNEVLDKGTAETKALHTITGGTVSAAVLRPGGLTVRLTTDVDPSGQTVRVLAGITDVNSQPMAAFQDLLVGP